MLLKDITPLHAAILEGAYDEHLESLRQALAHRSKVAMRQNGLTKNAFVKIVDDPRAGKIAGLRARVDKVNQKSVSIHIVDESVPEWERYWRVAPDLLEAC